MPFSSGLLTSSCPSLMYHWTAPRSPTTHAWKPLIYMRIKYKNDIIHVDLIKCFKRCHAEGIINDIRTPLPLCSCRSRQTLLFYEIFQFEHFNMFFFISPGAKPAACGCVYSMSPFYREILSWILPSKWRESKHNWFSSYAFSSSSCESCE